MPAVTITWLQPDEARRWFDAGAGNYDNAAVERLRTSMKNNRDFRLFAEVNGEVAARFAMRLSEFGRLTFWWPFGSDALDKPIRDEVTAALLRACVRFANSREDISYLETKPAFDTPDVDEWTTHLKQAGLQEIQRAHVFAIDLEDSMWSNAASTAEDSSSVVKFLPVDMVSPTVLGEIVGAIYSNTADRADQNPTLDVPLRIKELQSDSNVDFASELWSIAFVESRPAGLVFCSLDNKEVPLTGWIMLIGTHPDFRKQGLGKRLLKHGLKLLRGTGAKRIYALIDDENVASIALHSSMGFAPTAGHYMVYRQMIRPLPGVSYV